MTNADDIINNVNDAEKQTQEAFKKACANNEDYDKTIKTIIEDFEKTINQTTRNDFIKNKDVEQDDLLRAICFYWSCVDDILEKIGKDKVEIMQSIFDCVEQLKDFELTLDNDCFIHFHVPLLNEADLMTLILERQNQLTNYAFELYLSKKCRSATTHYSLAELNNFKDLCYLVVQNQQTDWNRTPKQYLHAINIGRSILFIICLLFAQDLKKKNPLLTF